MNATVTQCSELVFSHDISPRLCTCDPAIRICFQLFSIFCLHVYILHAVPKQLEDLMTDVTTNIGIHGADAKELKLFGVYVRTMPLIQNDWVISHIL